ncbi:Hypothetical predicted protein [Mytilus galloprovincialis]|uniref:Uncharacterized protein n=1 Tax=Mytilus galloprovincialis TaxID=29158 RepID=A0A8B6FRD7_MYTGA|nr:Hypothetical predicted protein [Mytilus galloprovincialis]
MSKDDNDASAEDQIEGNGVSIFEELDRNFTEKELEDNVRKLNKNKSPGVDNIVNEYIIESKPVLLPLLCKLFNVILCTGFFPELWVKSIIVPLFKKGPVNDPGNYRGCGGWMDGRYFHCSFPEFILDQNLHINLLEMLTIVVALKLWGKHFTNLKVIIYCDNMVSVRVLNTGATRNEFLQSCLREVCWIAAVNNFELKAKHISGCDNRLPDLLSRWDLDYKFQLDFYERTKGMSLFRDLISKELFQFEHIW